MGINIYEILALLSLLGVGYAAGWCFKGLWDKERSDCSDDQKEEEQL
jgi:hypothetical protein